VTDKPKKPGRDIKDLKAKLGLAKPGAKPSGGGAVPPPGGAVPPPGGVAPPPGGITPPGGGGGAPSGGIVPPGGVVPPGGGAAPSTGGGVVPPAGYQQPGQAAQAAAPVGDLTIGDDEFGGSQMHGKKELIFRIILGSLAVIAFLVGTQCGKTVIIRGWVNKVTDDSQKIVENLKVLNQSVRRLEALQQQLPLTKKRGGGMIDNYSVEYGNKAETLVGPMENLKEAEIFGIFYNMLKPEDQPVVAQLFTYFALLKRLRVTVTAMRAFEYQERDALSIITPKGQEKLKEMQNQTKFGAFFTGPRSVALAILEPEKARCGPKLEGKCGSKSPEGYVIDAGGQEKKVRYDAEESEEKLLDLNIGGMGGLADCFGGSTEVQRQLSQAKGAWQIYIQYRMAIGKLLKEIEAKAKPSEILKTYEKYATRPKINKYIIF